MLSFLYYIAVGMPICFLIMLVACREKEDVTAGHIFAIFILSCIPFAREFVCLLCVPVIVGDKIVSKVIFKKKHHDNET